MKAGKVFVFHTKNMADSLDRILHTFQELEIHDQRILVKPNWVNARSSQTGATTSIELVERVVAFFLEKNADVVIGEGAGFEFNTDQTFQVLNVKSLTEKYGIPIVNLRDDATIKVDIKGKVLKRINLPQTVLNAERIINLPKLKTHTLTGVSFAMKNLLGLLPDEDRRKAHVFGLGQSIVDLNKHFTNVFTILDGMTAMCGEGPVFGNTINPHLLIAGSRTSAVDKVACDVVGINYQQIHHIRLAEQQGLLPTIEVLGDADYTLPVFTSSSATSYYRFKYWSVYALDYLLQPFLKRSLIPSIITQFGTKVEINADACNKCDKCITVCPTHAISSDLTIDFERCRYLRCFRCYDICPHKAINVKGFSKPKSEPSSLEMGRKS